MSFFRRVFHWSKPEAEEAEGEPEVHEDIKAPPYAYSPLPSPTHIRLVVLAASKHQSAPIQCSLQEYDIDSPQIHPYSAVSYTWGQDTARHRIYLVQDHLTWDPAQQSQLLVQSNLFDLLHHLRQPDNDRWLWIDAICINQHSNEERNCQVSMMNQIFSLSKVVIAWLESTDYEPHLIQLHLKVSADKALSLDNRAILQKVLRMMEPFGKNLVWRSDADKMDLMSLAFFCTIPYWTRKWIIQEVVLATNVTLQVGHETLPMTAMEQFFAYTTQRTSNYQSKYFDRYKNRYNGLNGYPAAMLALQRLDNNQGVGNLQAQKLHPLLHRFQLNECKESADHVYALINLVGNHRRNLKIDYDQSASERYVEVLRFLQQDDGMASEHTIYYSTLLASLLDANRLIHPQPNLPLHPLQGRKIMRTALNDIGRVELVEKSEESATIRSGGLAVLSMQVWGLTKHEMGHWTVSSISPLSPAVEPENSSQFKISGTCTYGFTSCAVEDGDWVLVAPTSPRWGTYAYYSPYMFILRMRDETNALLLGRGESSEAPKGERVLPPAKMIGQVELLLSMGELLSLACWADMRHEEITEHW